MSDGDAESEGQGHRSALERSLEDHNAGALGDEAIDQQWHAVTEAFLRDAQQAAQQFPEARLHACGELLFALGRYLRDCPTEFKPESQPLTVVSALTSALRDLSAGVLPPLFADYLDLTRRGSNRPLPTSLWHARAICVATVEKLHDKASLSYNNAIEEVIKTAAEPEIGITDLRKHLSRGIRRNSADDITAIKDWRREIKEKVKNRDAKNFPLETVSLILPGPRIADSVSGEAAVVLILQWFRRQMAVWGVRRGKRTRSNSRASPDR